MRKDSINRKNVISCLLIEIKKLRKQKFTYITIMAIISFIILSGLFREKLAGSGFMTLGTASGWQIATFAASWTMKIAAFILLIFSVQLIADEFSDRTIKTMLSCPISRNDFLLGKFFTILIFTFLLVTIIFLISFIIGNIWGAMSSLEERGYVLASGKKLILSYLVAYFLNIFTLFTIGIFAATIALLLPKPALAIGMSIVIYFLLNIAGQFDSIQKFLFTNYISFPIDTAKEISYGLSTPWTPNLYWCFFISGMTIIICALISTNFFQRKDILV